ncbi:MAG: hypothetical protein ACK5LF_07430 [Bacteroides xylanisolvens]
MSKKCLKCGCELSDDSSNYCPNCIKEEGNKQSYYAENVLTIMTCLTLIVGIIASLVIIKKEDIALGLGILISSVFTWAVLVVLCNISNNLHEINKKMN